MLSVTDFLYLVPERKIDRFFKFKEGDPLEVD
jgi:hypothetical protein